jgi:peptidyl-prolyl cis-trans isomerase D
MEKFRNLSNNIFFKIFLGFLGLSFIMFGVSGFILGNNKSWVAKVDGKTIYYDKFLQTLQDTRESASRSNNSPEALEYLQSSQFRQDILQQMITQNLIQSLKNKFQIYPDKNLILQEIISNPNLKGVDGKFDRKLYTNLLQSNRITEKQHIEDITNEIAGNLIIQSFVAPQSFNQNLAKDLYQYQFETRGADLITISTKNVGNIKDPNHFELNDYFEKHNEKFALPEMRRVSFVSFGIDDLKSKITISNEEITQEYQNNKNKYSIPESRNVYHILLDDEKEADEFFKSITSKSADKNQEQVFFKLAIAKGKDKSTIVIDDIFKQNLPKEIANDVFSLAKNQYSKVLKSQMGYHIFYITNITPVSKIPLTKVRDGIKLKLASIKEEDQAKQKLRAIEDEILATNSIDKISEKFNLDINKSLPKFNAQGADSKNTRIKTLDDFDDFIQNSFTLSANTISKIFFSKTNKKYYIILVDEVNQSRQRSLDEVKVLATDLWINDQKQQALQKLANNITKQINKDAGNVSLVVRKNGLKISKNLQFPRFYIEDSDDKKTRHSNKLLNNIFATKINQATNPILSNDGELVIAVIRNKKSPTIDEQKLRSTIINSQDNFQTDISSAFNDYIQQEFLIEVNTKIMQAIE